MERRGWPSTATQERRRETDHENRCEVFDCSRHAEAGAGVYPVVSLAGQTALAEESEELQA